MFQPTYFFFLPFYHYFLCITNEFNTKNWDLQGKVSQSSKKDEELQKEVGRIPTL